MENTLAAQYLRVSTERQEYSLGLQSAGIATYAQEHNFTVCETYIDEAKSDLGLRHRKGLSQLLHDVFAGSVYIGPSSSTMLAAGVDFKTPTNPPITNFSAKPLAYRCTTVPSISRTTATYRM